MWNLTHSTLQHVKKVASPADPTTQQPSQANVVTLNAQGTESVSFKFDPNIEPSIPFAHLILQGLKKGSWLLGRKLCSTKLCTGLPLLSYSKHSSGIRYLFVVCLFFLFSFLGLLSLPIVGLNSFNAYNNKCTNIISSVFVADITIPPVDFYSTFHQHKVVRYNSSYTVKNNCCPSLETFRFWYFVTTCVVLSPSSWLNPT